MTDSFTPKLGRIGWKHGTRLDRYINKVRRAAHTVGHVGSKRSGFTGSRVGRGSAFGTLAAAGLYPGSQRRVIVKARITKFRAGDLGAARAHLRYIQRDGVTPEGRAGQLYDRVADDAVGSGFLDKCEDDRHQFRLIVSPEDGVQLHDLKPFIRDFMAQVERDLETSLDWVAVDHYNTAQPHTHIVIRGKDDTGHDLVITRDYMSHGFRQRARELVTLELGSEHEHDMMLKLSREVQAERFTRLDRALLKHVDQGFLVVSAMPPEDRQTHASHMGRLKTLQSLGLAEERQTGVWQLGQDIERKLRSLGQRGDIVKIMHRVLREARIERPAGTFAVFDTQKSGGRVVGRVAGIGLTDEINDRHYVVIDGVDGRVHYADVGHLQPEFVPEKGMIVAVQNGKADDSGGVRSRLRILSYLNLETLAEAEGATWLDKELLARSPERMSGTGFGAAAAATIQNRRQWLARNRYGSFDETGTFHPTPNMLDKLRQRDIQRAIQSLSSELGMAAVHESEYLQPAGSLTRTITLASGKYALFEQSKEFALVPWRPEFEKSKAVRVDGNHSGAGINVDWRDGRRRSGPTIS